jgi:hypothetical protein
MATKNFRVRNGIDVGPATGGTNTANIDGATGDATFQGALKGVASVSNNYFTLPNATGTNGQVLTSNGATAPAWTSLSGLAVTSITGTANQVIASASTGAVTLSTPQDIATTSEPTFAGATLGSIQIGVTPYTNDTIISTSGNMLLTSTNITLSAAVDLFALETQSYHRLAKRVTATNTINPVARISLESTGTPTVGFGPSLQFQSEVGVGGNPVTVGDIAYVSTDMTVGAENFQLQLSAKKNGATPDYKVYIDSDGNVSADGNLVLNYDQTAANAVITGYNSTTAGTLTWDGTTWTSSNGLKATGSLSNNYFTLPNATGTNGQVLASNGSTAPAWTDLSSLGVTSITGTANQVIASASTGAVTLSTPQDIATTSTPTFAGITAGVVTVGPGDNDTITTTSGNLFLQSTGGTVQVNNDFKSIGSLSNNYFTLPNATGTNGQILTSNGSTAPTWTSLSSLGVTSITGTANQVIASASTGAVTLSTPQDIATTSSPTFNSLTLTTPLAVSSGGTGRAVGNYSVFANEIHVSKNGNDTTGDGTLINPVLTITKALTLIAGLKKTIIVHPGDYPESPTISTANTTIATSELTGANTTISGTLTLSAAARVSGIKLTNLTITGSGNTYISNCTVDTQVIKSGSNYVEIINSELQCVSGIQITGAGTVSIVGNKCWAVAVSNASANVLIKDCFQVITPSVTAGTLQFDGCAIFAASPSSNAVTSSASSFITLANSFVLNSAGTNVERVSLSGFYSILNLVYDKPNSTLIATSGTGGNLNAIDYFSVINADTVAGTSGLTLLTVGSNGNITLTPHGTGNIALNSANITTTATTANLLNTTATTLNIGNAATTASIGATTGTTTVRNALSVTGGNITTTTGSNIINGASRSYNSIVAQEGRYSGSNDIQRDNNGRASNGFLASNWANLSQNGQRILIRDYQITATSTPGYNFPTSAFASEVSRNATLTSTAASGDGSTATLTFAAQTVPPYIVGSSIVVDNIVPTGYRTSVSAVVTACTTTTVSYANTTTGAQTVAASIRGSGAANASDSLMTIYAQPNFGSTNGSGLGDGWSSDTMPYPPGAFRLTASQNQRQTTTATFTASFANATINAQTTGQMTVSAMTGTSLTTTAASGTGTTATLTFAAQTYIPYAVGSFITVAGVTPTGYNGYYKVTACTTTTVSFANTTTGAQTVAGTTQGAIGVGNEIRSASLTTAAPGSVFIINRQQSGTPGGAGVYALNVVTGTISSGTVTSLLIQAAQDLLFSTTPANTAVSDVTRFSAFAFTPNSSNLGSNLAVNNLGVTPVFASYVPRYQKITTIATDAVLGDIITIPAHGLRIRDTVIPTTTANGLTAATIYYVQSVTNANQVRLTTTVGGAGLTGLTAGTGLYLEIETTGGYGIGGDNSLQTLPTTGRASSILIGTARLGYGQGGTAGNGQKYQGMVSGDELGLIRFSGTAGVVGSTTFQYMYPTQIISSATENWNYTNQGSQTVIQNTRAGQSAAVITPTNISGDGTTVTVSYTNTGQWFGGQAPFVNGTYITIAGAQPAGYNGTYQIASISATQLTFTSATTGTMIIPGTLTQGVVNSIVTNPTSQTYASDVHTFTTAPGSSATAVQTLITANATSTTFTKPVGFPVYTAVAAGAITGAVGQQISISNSPTVGGRMAFWDTTNSRWSYISDNTAV